MNAIEFTNITGRAPENDDLERANCVKAGDESHNMCGQCVEHGQPRFIGAHLQECTLR